MDKFYSNSISENSLDEYILEVDFEYTNELHTLHNDYQLATEKIEINHNMLSTWSIIANEYGIKVGGVNKLVPNLSN